MFFINGNAIYLTKLKNINNKVNISEQIYYDNIFVFFKNKNNHFSIKIIRYNLPFKKKKIHLFSSLENFCKK